MKKKDEGLFSFGSAIEALQTGLLVNRDPGTLVQMKKKDEGLFSFGSAIEALQTGLLVNSRLAYCHNRMPRKAALQLRYLGVAPISAPSYARQSKTGRPGGGRSLEFGHLTSQRKSLRSKVAGNPSVSSHSGTGNGKGYPFSENPGPTCIYEPATG
ncbi:hypothetical protein Bbelb_378410 [Branchiostoma belcheri]|nr:hypothetical protein Bbelb_378410 [Branchiostoma belcheri]